MTRVAAFTGAIRCRVVRYAPVLLIVAALCGPEPANAQEADGESAGIEEIIVTATKRGAVNLQDVPMSITAISNTELQRMGAVEFADYAGRVPNLSFAYTGDGRENSRGLAIRGISGTGTTGFYIDDVPLQEGIDPRVFDIERVEVLRGPQGTLYGAQSMGGTLRIVTAQPDVTRYSGRAHAGVSSVEDGGTNYQLDAALNIPLLEDRSALRISGFYEDRSGFFDRRYVDPANPAATIVDEDINDDSLFGIQAALLWRPGDNLTIVPRVWYQRYEADNPAFADVAADNVAQERVFNIDEPGEDEWINLSLGVEYEADFGTFTSSTSFFDRSIEESEDGSEVTQLLFSVIIPAGLAEPLPAPYPQTDDIRTFSQEFRFSSAFDGPLQFVAGVFYSEEKQEPTLTGIVPGLDDATAIPFGTDTVATIVVDQTVEEIALFGELSYQLSDQFLLTVGGRWFDNSFENDRLNDGIFFGGPGTEGGNQDEDGFNPKIQLEYAPNEDVLIYANRAEGFRRGLANNPVPTVCEADAAALGISLDDLLTVDSDDIVNYELGFKAQWMANRLRLNGAVFQIDWDDIQQTAFLPCGAFFTSNVGEAESTGVELELYAQPVDNLTLSAGIGYTDAEITDPEFSAFAEEGDPIDQVPEWTYSLSADYSFAINDSTRGFGRVDYSYTDESFSGNNDQLEPRRRDSYELLNLRAGVEFERWQIELFVKNALDERANFADNVSIALELPGRPRIVTNRPRTTGLDVRVFF